MALPWRSKFSFKDMRNDVSGFRLGGTPAPNQNPMQTLNEDVSDSWAGGSSSPAHQSMQTSMQVSSSVQTHELVSGYWGDGSSASSHYPMQTGSCFSELTDLSMLNSLACLVDRPAVQMSSSILSQAVCFAKLTDRLARHRNNFGSGCPADYRKRI